MPTYEYECRKCGHCFEKFQSITAPPVKTCPKCRGRVARLLSGGAGIIFRGSGFYQTDYKQAGKPPPAAAKATDKKPEGGAAGGEKPQAAKADKASK